MSNVSKKQRQIMPNKVWLSVDTGSDGSNFPAVHLTQEDMFVVCDEGELVTEYHLYRRYLVRKNPTLEAVK